MAVPSYASPLEKIWYDPFRVICALIFVFLTAPILIVIPLSFNAERYFTFTEKMMSLDPTGYSMRWYDLLLILPGIISGALFAFVTSFDDPGGVLDRAADGG